MTSLEDRAVLPFYLHVMGLNAIDHPPWSNHELVQTGRELSLPDARRLLAARTWRSVVMGAWFSLAFPATEIAVELRGALQRSTGSLTAPPLATACLLITHEEAVPELEHYVQRAPADGSAEFVAAVIEALGDPPSVAVTDVHRERVRAMIAVGTRLRDELTRAA